MNNERLTAEYCPWCKQTFKDLFRLIENAAEDMGKNGSLYASVWTIDDDNYEGWYIRDLAHCALRHERIN